MALADWANVFGLTGVLLLAYPAVFVARYAGALTRLAGIPANTTDPMEISLREKTRRELATRRDGWSSSKSFCLIGGTLLAAVSYALPLAPVVWHLL